MPSPGSRPRSVNGPASRRSRSATIVSSGTSSRCRTPTGTSFRGITSAGRR
jgi:hypothetical protein